MINDVNGFENHCIIKWREDYEQQDYVFDEFYSNTYHTIIDNQLIGHKIAKEICDKLNKDILRDDGEYDIGIICEMIDEDYLNDVRICIQNHVEEYLNNHLEVD